jgi:hypothetical protein
MTARERNIRPKQQISYRPAYLNGPISRGIGFISNGKKISSPGDLTHSAGVSLLDVAAEGTIDNRPVAR